MEQEFLERFAELEKKVDAIYTRLDQAAGAWIVFKVLGSISLGATVLYNFIAGHWR